MYFTPPNAPDDAALTAGLAPAATTVTDMPYFDWLNRIYDLVQQLMALRLPGPWINVFLPDEATDQYMTELMTTLTPADAGGVVLLYPVPRGEFTRPFVTLPDSPVIFLLALLRAVNPPNQAEVDRLLADNRRLYDRARAVGGTHYPVGAINLTPADWRDHYGSRYPRFLAAKKRYDPNHVLTPGQHIFR
jgi:FAD/FMN-containing dehydrogenase